MRAAFLRLFSSVVLLTAILSCHDVGRLAGPPVPRAVSFSLAPSFALTTAGTAPINLIRLVAIDAETSAPLGHGEFAVDPAQSQWQLSFNVLVSGARANAIVVVQLLNKPATGTPTVEWSGRTAPISVTVGEETPVADVTLGRGDLDNLDVTGLTVADPTGPVVEGATVQLAATVQGPANAQVFWSSLDDAVATVDATGLVTTLRDGSARIVAEAGTKADTVQVSAAQRPASINLSLTSVTFASAGLDTTVTATVVDPRGTAIAGATVDWSVANTAVATYLGNGKFHAVASGTTQATATVTGFTTVQRALTISVAAAAAPAVVAKTAGDAQTATVGTAVAVAPAVTALDNGGKPVSGANVTFAIASGGGSITGAATVATDANGIAALGGWTLGNTAGANTLTATVSGVSPVTFTATGVAGAPAVIAKVSGDAQTGTSGTALSSPLVVAVRDALGNPVAGTTVNWTPSDGSVTPTNGNTDASGQTSTTWTPGFGGTAQTVSASSGQLTAVSFGATVTIPPPSVILTLLDVDKVSVGHSAMVKVQLTKPAPVGAAVGVAMSSGNPSVLAVSGQTPVVTIAGGASTGTALVNGIAEGTALLHGNAPGYTEGTLNVGVETRVISLPATASVPYGLTASLPITLARPAPVGGITVTLTTSDASKVNLASTQIVIPAGATGANATLQGINPGTSTIVATNSMYDPDTVIATTAASLNITATTVSLDQSFGTNILVRFESNGVAVPAPAPGITVSFDLGDAACVNIPATATIPTGLVDVTVPLTYGGTATAPCTTAIHANATNLKPDTVTATVAVKPSITLGGAISVGSGLQRQTSFSLGTSNHGGVTVHLVSADPTVALISPNATTAGTATLDVPVFNGTSAVAYYMQGVEGKTGSSVVTATVPGFTTGSATTTIVTPALDVSNVLTTTNTFAADNAFVIRTGIPNTGNASLSQLQAPRAGGPTPTVTATSTNPAAGALTPSTDGGATATTTVPTGQTSSPGTVATGGIAIHPAGNGTTTISASIPGYLTMTSSGSATVAVSTPGISTSNQTIGSGLMLLTSFSLGSSSHGGVTVHIASSDPTLALVSPNLTTAGTASIDIVVPNGTAGVNYAVHGLENKTGTATVTISAPGFSNGSSIVTVQQPALDIVSLSTTHTSLDADNPFVVRVGTGSTSSLNALQQVRFGGAPLTVTVTSQTPTVGQIVSPAGTAAASATVQIVPGQSSSPSTVAGGGVAFRVTGGGQTAVTAAIPGFVTTTNGTVTVNVTAPTMTLNTTRVGSGLQLQTNGFLGTSGHSGVTVHLVSANPSVALLSPNATTAGTPSIDIPITAGGTSFSYYVQGVEAQTGTSTITATASGFTSANTTATIVQPGLDIVNLVSSMTTLAVNDPFTARVGIPNGTGPTSSLNQLQAVRAGAPGPLTVSITNSTSNVGRLVTSAATGDAVTIQIPIGQTTSNSPATAGGVEFDPLTSGTTTVAATIAGFVATGNASVTVTVVPPSISVVQTTVGAGLMISTSGSLSASGHGGVTVHIVSSQPSVMLVSPNATTAGTASIDIPILAGNTSFSYYVHGVNGQTGTATITASTPGFTDGTTTSSVVQAAIDVSSLFANQAFDGVDDPFTVRVGIPTGVGATSLQQLQLVRVGGGAFTATITSSNPAAGAVKTSAANGGSVTVTIPEGQYNSPTSVATGGVAFDPIAGGTTTVSASVPGVLSTTNATATVTVTGGGPP